MKIWTIDGIRNKSKKIYAILTGNEIPVKKQIDWNTPGIWNFLGGNFKQYIIKNDMTAKLLLLKNNLDRESVALVDELYKRLILFPDLEMFECFAGDFNKIQETYRTAEENQIEAAYNNELQSYRDTYTFPKLIGYNCDVFYFHHGLRFCNHKIKEYIKNKDFIDGGAFIGDSAVILNRYDPKKIYSFEISQANIQNYYKAMELNNIPVNRYQLIGKGISDKKEQIMIEENTQFDQRTNIVKNGTMTAELTDIDSFGKENNLDFGFIKLDVEGAGYNAVIGMQETIKKSRPVLSIAIYHNPIEFFELKPLLEEYTKDLNYKFEIKKLEANIYHPLVETVLFAYPAELS